jgi:hypothetical protein
MAREAIPEGGFWAGLGDATLSLPDYLREVLGGSPVDAVNRWMLAAACAYGTEQTILIVPANGQTACDDPLAELTQSFRADGGKVIEIGTTRPAAGAAGPFFSLPAASATLRPRPASASRLRLGPPDWLRELGDFFREAGGEWSERWRGYGRAAMELFGLLDLRFEPVEVLTPKTVDPLLVGFEVLGMPRSGGTYGALVDEAGSAGVKVVDLDLAIFAMGLQCIRKLCSLLEKQTRRTAELWFTLNVSHPMLESPVFDMIIDRSFVPELRPRIQLELSEGFPEGLRLARSTSDQNAILRSALGRLHDLMKRRLEIVLDDSDKLDARVRAALRHRAVKAKADARFVRDVLLARDIIRDTGASPRHIIDELEKFRIAGKPYVLEGVETDAIADFLLEHWPNNQKKTWMQGWAIKLRPPLTDVLVPVNTPEQPRGYRVAEAYRAQAWLD